MNSYQRVLSAVNRKETDVVPVVPVVGSHATRLAGMSLKSAFTDARKQADALILALKKYEYDGVCTVMDLTVEAEALGAKIKMLENEMPSVLDHPVTDRSSLEKLVTPEIEKTRMGVFIDATRRLSDALDKEYAINSLIIGPFTLSCRLADIALVLKNTYKDPEFTHKLLRFCTTFICDYARLMCDAGTHAVAILEPSANLISPTAYCEFSAPYVKIVAAVINKKKAVPILHICGNTNAIIDKMPDTGVRVLSLDSAVDIGEAKKLVRNRVALMGNVAPVNTLLLKGPKDVRNECATCISKTGRVGLILSSGCEVPIDTPPANISEMVKTARES